MTPWFLTSLFHGGELSDIPMLALPPQTHTSDMSENLSNIGITEQWFLTQNTPGSCLTCCGSSPTLSREGYIEKGRGKERRAKKRREKIRVGRRKGRDRKRRERRSNLLFPLPDLRSLIRPCLCLLLTVDTLNNLFENASNKKFCVTYRSILWHCYLRNMLQFSRLICGLEWTKRWTFLFFEPLCTSYTAAVGMQLYICWVCIALPTAFIKAYSVNCEVCFSVCNDCLNYNGRSWKHQLANWKLQYFLSPYDPYSHLAPSMLVKHAPILAP